MSRPPRTRTHLLAPPRAQEARPVSKPDDRHEREAERAAETVARGGSVSSFSFSAVPAAAVQRQESGKPKSDDEKKKEALEKTGEALLETKPVKDLKDKVLADPGVKKIKDAVTSPVGIAATGVVAAGGVGALAAAHKPLPFQPPSIPLDKITPGLSAQVKYEGPVDRPTFVGLTLTYKEQGPKAKKESESDRIAADVARLKAEQEMFKPASQKAAEKQEADELVQAWIRSQNLPRLTIPLTPGTAKQEDVPKKDEPPKKDEEKAPVQPAPASTTSAPPAEAYVDDALEAPGRPLDPATRRSLESRFGYDFSGVRVHDDARAAATAAGLEAAAFTVGEDIVFGVGRFDPASAEGRRLLAHELAHVVQQSRGAPGGSGPVVQRRSIFESLGILLGIAEGTWEDRELHEYLDAMAASGKIEGSYDSDNKARAIVRRWKASTPGFDLLAQQKILLIREMLDGPTLGGDEECILDLLELSDASDLRAIFASDGIALTNLESDINGDNRRRLDAFVAGRFRGGRDAVLAHRIEVVGSPVPTGAPHFAFDPTLLDARFDSDRSADELIALLERMQPADRTQALHYLVTGRRVRQTRDVERLDARHEDATDPSRKDAFKRLLDRAKEERLKTERVILHFQLEAVPASEQALRSGTTATDPARAAELRAALRPEQPPATTFRPILPGEQQSYEEKIRAHLPDLVDEYYQGLVPNHGPAEHADPAQVHQLSEFEAIGNVSKAQTDKVYGRFYDPSTHPALTGDRPHVRGNLHDRFAQFQSDFSRMTADDLREWAKFRLFYFFQTDSWVRRLNQRHGATPVFDKDNVPQDDAARSLDKVAKEFVAVAANVTRLNEITRNWRAGARGSDILVQVFRGATPVEDRQLLWKMFQILIHEYLHTLAHADYRAYADSLGTRSNEFNTLIEGVDSLLTEIVWANVEPHVREKALRTSIEGVTNASQPEIDVPHVSQTGRYASYTEALRLVDLVGIENLYAAYFLGLVDRIGGSVPPPAPGGRP